MDPIRGHTIQWTFQDGPMAGKAYEHAFEEDGGVTFRPVDGDPGPGTQVEHCEVAPIAKDVYAVSYLSDSGYTLTSVLDFRTHQVVAFASNEKELTVQHGTFETRT